MDAASAITGDINLSVHFNILVSEKFDKALKQAAKKRNLNKSELVRQLAASGIGFTGKTRDAAVAKKPARRKKVIRPLSTRRTSKR